jgi:hypothetical protein
VAMEHVIKAKGYIDDGNVTQAFSELRIALSKDKNNKEANHMLSSLLVQLPDESLQGLLRSVHVNPDSLAKLLSLLAQESLALQFMRDIGIDQVLDLIIADGTPKFVPILQYCSRISEYSQKSLNSILSPKFIDFYTNSGSELLALDIAISTFILNASNQAKESVKRLSPLFEYWIKKCGSAYSDPVRKSAMACLMRAISSQDLALLFLELSDSDSLYSLSSSNTLKPLFVGILSQSLSCIKEPILKSSYLKLLEKKIEADLHNVRGLYLLSSLIQADPVAGGNIISKDDLLANLMDTLEYDSNDVQSNVIELLFYAANIKTMRKQISDHCGTYLLRKYKTESNPKDSTMALLTLSKLFSDSKAIQDEILSPSVLCKFADIIKTKQKENWAIFSSVEGLAYLSVHVYVKEMISQDSELMECIFQLCKESETALQYGLAVIFSNLTKYPIRLTDEEKQMQKLHEMASPEAPKQRLLETDESVNLRINLLISYRLFVQSIVNLGLCTSENVKELIAQSLLSISSDPKHRGDIIQAGGCKVLLSLSNSCVESGKYDAAQALAKIAITSNPFLAFKGEMVLELIRPLLMLSDSPKQLLQFESLMALTNLASIDDSVRSKIWQLKGVDRFEQLQFSDNVMIQRAATEALCNMICYPHTFDSYVNNSTRLKIMVAFCDSEDFETRRAASGAIAILSSTKKGVQAILKQPRFEEIIVELARDENEDIQKRTFEIIKNCAAK